MRDNGPGIDPEDLDHIFDPFFTKRDVGEGMGLGLSICHRILETHDGRIEVESDPGHFTVFSVMVPQPWQGEADSGCETDSEDPESGPEQGPAPRRESRSDTVELEEAWKK